jgi:hypothetical protein
MDAAATTEAKAAETPVPAPVAPQSPATAPEKSESAAPAATATASGVNEYKDGDLNIVVRLNVRATGQVGNGLKVRLSHLAKCRRCSLLLGRFAGPDLSPVPKLREHAPGDLAVGTLLVRVFNLRLKPLLLGPCVRQKPYLNDHLRPEPVILLLAG